MTVLSMASVTGPRDHGSVTGTFRALDHVFAVRTPIEPLRQHIERLFAPLAIESGASYAVRYDIAETREGGVRLTRDDHVVVDDRDPSRALAFLLWDVNRSAVEHTDRLILLHAAAVAEHGHAVLLPAAMEAGKSTLTVALLRAGFDYVTDEIVAIDPATTELVAYPRAISLDPGSWTLFHDLRPQTDPAVEPYLPHQWQLAPTDISGARVAGPCRPAAVAFPAHVPGAMSRLERMPPEAALVAFAETTFRFSERARDVLGTLHRLSLDCPAYRLTVGDDMRDAIRLIRSILSP